MALGIAVCSIALITSCTRLLSQNTDTAARPNLDAGDGSNTPTDGIAPTDGIGPPTDGIRTDGIRTDGIRTDGLVGDTLQPSKRARGIYDTSFATGGVHSESGYLNGNYFNAVLVAPLGQVYVAGALQVNSSDWGDIILQRLHPNGSLDVGFNFTGTRIVNFTPFELAVGLHITGQGKLRLGGARTVQEDPLVMGFNDDGTTDTDFGSAGIVLKGIAGENYPRAMAVDPVDGAFYIVGDDYGDTPYAVKFTAAGAVDSSFSGDGHLVLPGLTYGEAIDVQVDANRRVVIVGEIKPAGATDDKAAILWRLNPNGSLDTSFGNGGVLILDDVFDTGVDESAKGLVLDQADMLYVTGSASGGGVSDLVVWKLDETGGPVSSFGTGGVYRATDLASAGGSGGGSALKLDASGDLVIVGSGSNGSNMDIVLLRLRRDGILDSSFGDGGKVIVSDVFGEPADDYARALDFGLGGSIYVAGMAMAPDGYRDAILIKVD
ncbi:MAG: hypothetical protein JRH20_14700 [Deltaproteobacteria bacterium]|nr:hypothetical protein [Deltaproteobacteria bacterium]